MTEDRSIARHDFDPDGCPECAGIDIDGGSVDIEGQEARQEVSCCDCDCHWVDIYRLDRRHVTRDRGGFWTLFVKEDDR